MLHYNSERGQAGLEAAVIFVVLLVVGYFLTPFVAKLLAGSHPANTLGG